MLGVVAHLDLAAARRLVDGLAHGVGHVVGVHHHAPRDVARGTPDGLDETAVVAQEALLVGVEYAHERHFGQVEALAQQVYPHEHVEFALAQLLQQLDALHRADVGVQVVGSHARVEQVVGQLLGHLFSERRDEHALACARGLLNLGQQVVYLAFGGAQLYFRVQQAGGADDLLDHLLRDALLVVARRGRHVDELRDARLELVVAQGAVVEGRGQPKTVFHERDFAAAVAFVHATDLRDRHVALVDDGEKALAAEIVEQGVGRLARTPPIEVARVVLDAGAKAHGLEHLQVVGGALL